MQKTISFAGKKITYDMDLLTAELERLLAEGELRTYPEVMWDDGVIGRICVKLDDGYGGEEDEDVDYWASGHHLLRLTEPDSGEGFVLVSLVDYSADIG